MSAAGRGGGRGEGTGDAHTGGRHRSPLAQLRRSGPVLRGCQQSQAVCKPHRSQGFFYTGVTTRWYKALNSYFFTPLEDAGCLTPEPSGKAGRHTACCLDALLSSAGLVWKMKCHSPHHCHGPFPGAGASLSKSTARLQPSTRLQLLGPSGSPVWETRAAWADFIRVVVLVRFGLVAFSSKRLEEFGYFVCG